MLKHFWIKLILNNVNLVEENPTPSLLKICLLYKI